MVLLAAGCKSDKPDRRPEPPPKVRDLGSGKPATQPVQLTEGVVERFSLPLYEPLDKAWAVTVQDPIDPVMLELWRQNGMRVALLDPTQYGAFVEALPQGIGREAKRLILQSRPIPLAVSARTTRAREVELITGDDGPRDETIPAGTPQFLVSLQPAEDGRVVASVTPHVHHRRVSVVPRSPLEALYDGRAFEELTLRSVLTDGRLLVIGLEEIPERPEPAPTTQPATQPAVDPNEPLLGETQPAEARPKTRLSDLLLTAERLKRPTQMLVIVGLPTREQEAPR